MRGCLTVLLILILLILGGSAAAAYWVAAPDLPPLQPPSVPSWDQVRENLPLLRPASEDLPPVDRAAADQEMERVRAQREGGRAGQHAQESQALGQLQTTGLPITSVYLLETSSGGTALTASVNLDALVGGSSRSGGLQEAVGSLQRLVDSGALDFSGTDYVTVAVRDVQGRVLFGVTARTQDIQRYRAGQMSRTDFVARTAARAESRAGVLDAIRKLAP